MDLPITPCCLASLPTWHEEMSPVPQSLELHVTAAVSAARFAFTCGSLLSPSRKFVLAAACGKHHRRQRWDSYNGERAFQFTCCHGNHLCPQNSLLPNSGTAYSVNWQIWKQTKSNTHTHTLTWVSHLKWLSWSPIRFYTQMLSCLLKSHRRDHLISQVEHLFSAWLMNTNQLPEPCSWWAGDWYFSWHV